MQKVFKVGDRIEIVRIDKRTWTEKGIQYVSKIADVKDEYFYIFTPIKEGVYITFFIDEIIRVYKVMLDGVWMFDAVVEERFREPEYMIKVKQISDYQKIQRRMFYRLPINLEVFVKLYEENNNKDNANIASALDGFTEGRIVSGLTKDLSGGGVCFLTREEFDINDVILIKIPIEDEYLILKAQILRKNRIDHYHYRFLYGCRFIEAKQNEIDKIVKFVFKEQQKLRKKGLL